MQPFAATPTWGIPGPIFLVIYVVLVAANLWLVLYLRRRALQPPSTTHPPASLPPVDMAYLAGGRDRAIAAALTALRSAGAITTDESGKFTPAGPPPSDSGPLERALHHVIASGYTTSRLATRRSVAAELSAIERRLGDAALLVPATTRRQAKYAGLWLLPVIALGCLRVSQGNANGQPSGYLTVLTLIVIGICGLLVMLPTPLQSPKGKRLLNRLRSQHRHLKADLSPATSAYGSTSGVVAVALFGTALLWQQDPEFAKSVGSLSGASGIGGTSATYSHSCSTGSSGGDSGGSSCGGGGGCGG